MAVDARKEEYEHVELFGKPALFTDSRISRFTVPQGWFCYDLRGSDYDPGRPVMLENRVVVNHAGSILAPTEVKFREGKDCVRLKDGLNFLGECLTLEQFCEEHGLDYPANTRKYVPYPASRQEAGLFYRMESERDEAQKNEKTQQLVGRLTFANGDVLEFTDPVEYVQKLGEEIESIATTGMKYETLTDDPQTRKAVDDIVYDHYGEDNPRLLEDYEATTQTMELGGM